MRVWSLIFVSLVCVSGKSHREPPCFVPESQNTFWVDKKLLRELPDAYELLSGESNHILAANVEKIHNAIEYSTKTAISRVIM